MQMIRKKIRSQRGASITYALLLFLVCAVIGSVVLTAGTVAAGRMSQVAEMDQRYYSVNSAARLLVDLIDGKEATVIEKKPTEAGAGAASSFTDGDGNAIDASSFDSIVKEAAYYMSKDVLSGTTPKTIEYTLSNSDDDIDALKVSITEKLDKDGKIGKMMLTVTDAKDKKYNLLLTFNMDMNPITEHDDAEGVDVITRKFTWHIRDIQVKGAERWATE